MEQPEDGKQPPTQVNGILPIGAGTASSTVATRRGCSYAICRLSLGKRNPDCRLPPLGIDQRLGLATGDLADEPEVNTAPAQVACAGLGHFGFDARRGIAQRRACLLDAPKTVLGCSASSEEVIAESSC